MFWRGVVHVGLLVFAVEPGARPGQCAALPPPTIRDGDLLLCQLVHHRDDCVDRGGGDPQLASHPRERAALSRDRRRAAGAGAVALRRLERDARGQLSPALYDRFLAGVVVPYVSDDNSLRRLLDLSSTPPSATITLDDVRVAQNEVAAIPLAGFALSTSSTTRRREGQHLLVPRNRRLLLNQSKT